MRPGFHHDVCSTVQPMAAAAPFFREFDPESRGVRLVHPEINFAHPLDGGRAAVSRRSLEETAAGLGADAAAYRRLFGPLVEHGTDVVDFFLTSRLRRLPTRSVPQIAHFGLNGLPNVRWLAHRYFDTEGARALLGGAAAHGMLDLSQPLTSALGMLLTMLSHHAGWPLIEGGSQKLADAMVTALEEQGGEVVTGHHVTDLREFDGVPAVLLDTTPEAFVAMAGDRVNEGYRRWVSRYRHGAGVFKIDWILSKPSLDQPRCPAGRHHPRGGEPGRDDRGGAGAQPGPAHRQALRPGGATDAPRPHPRTRGRPHLLGLRACVLRLGRRHDRRLENQIERFAPGFRDTVVDRTPRPPSRWSSGTPATWAGTSATARHPGADALPSGAPMEHLQDPGAGTYLASAATPPGPAVHGACGDNAAQVALREVFGVRNIPPFRPATR